jgi:hypothetical protein
MIPQYYFYNVNTLSLIVSSEVDMLSSFEIAVSTRSIIVSLVSFLDFLITSRSLAL